MSVKACGLAVFLVWVAALSAQSPTQSDGSGEFRVGATTRRFVPAEPYNWRGAKTHVLRTDIWYPTESSDAPSMHSIGPADAPWFRLGEWVDEGLPAAGRYPLVLLSHGTGGSSSMMAWLGHSLASRGYVVAAVNHPGNNSLDGYTVEGFSLWWERAKDLTGVIDGLLTDPALGERINAQQIGAAGFSLGGYTMMAVAGALTDPALFREFCRANGVAICREPNEFPGLQARRSELETSSADFRLASSRATASYRDPRIKAVLAIAPALGPAFVPDSLRRISIPVAIIAGANDEVADTASNAALLAANIPGSSLTVMPGATHYAFLAACTDQGRAKRPDLCMDSTGVDRDAIHRAARDAARSFFGRFLK